VRRHTLRDPTKPAPDPNNPNPNPNPAAVEVMAQESCSVGDVRLRHYEFAYAADGDTGQPRLQKVLVFGRDYTPEATVPIPVAKYSYGSAITGGRLNYGSTVQFDSSSSLGIELGSMQRTAPLVPVDADNGVTTLRQLIDVTGDGRPDIVEFNAQGQLN